MLLLTFNFLQVIGQQPAEKNVYPNLRNRFLD
jgi:hypothetical protein